MCPARHVGIVVSTIGDDAMRDRPRTTPATRAPRDLGVGSDAWKGYVADAMGVAPARRSGRQDAAIRQAMRGDEDLPEAERPMAARLAAAEERLGHDADGPACRLTSVDWHLYAGFRPKESERAAQALNAAVEDAVREGADLEEALEPVRARHREAGATDAEVGTVLRHVAAVLEGLRPAPGMI